MYCNIDGVDIYYETIGTGIPMLCLHGYYVDHNLMKGCLEPVLHKEVNYQRIYIDLIGMGNTKISSKVTSSDDMLIYILKFIKLVIKDQEFIIAGESYGGYLSLGIIHKIPQQVLGIFLICPAIQGKMEKRNLPKKSIIRHEEIKDISDERGYKGFVNMATIINETTWQRYQEDILVGIKKADIKYLISFKEDAYPFSFEEELLKIKYDKPATLLLGKQDHIVGYLDMNFYINNFSRGTYSIIDSASHNLQIEVVDLFNAHLRAFISNVAYSINKVT